MKLTVIGSGDAFSAGGRFQSCYMVEDGRSRYLLDFGATSLMALQRSAIVSNSIRAIFISHLHGDHFGGLPFLFIDAIFISRRTEPLVIAGPPGIEARFWLAIQAFYPGMEAVERKFELRFVELRPGASAGVEGMDVEVFPMRHVSSEPCFALRLSQNGKVLAFTGDTGWTENVIAAGRGADLYLMECYQYDFRLDLHLDYLQIAGQAAAIGAKRILLTHMGDAMLARRQDVDLSRFMLAEDGMSVEV
jgi:ribonuclease BN (tRNA processing enzyme)